MANSFVIGEIRRGYEIGKLDQRRGYIWQSCEICETLNWARIHKGKPYSKRCMKCANRERLIGKKREQSIAWNGGKSRSGGYVKVLMPENPRADVKGYMFEHIYVWETIHQMPVPDGYVIHHLNGIKSDNRPKNLCAMKKSLHIGQTQPYKKKIRELEVEIKLLRNALENNQMIFNIGEN